MDEKREKLPERPTKEELEAFFKNDTFAYEAAGCRVVEGWKGHGVAEMPLVKGVHFNAGNNVMGGAVFTLADYAFAVATMCGRASSVSLSSTIEFVRATKGSKLVATCDVDRSGNKVGFYTIRVEDDLGELVAKVSATCYHPV